MVANKVVSRVERLAEWSVLGLVPLMAERMGFDLVELLADLTVVVRGVKWAAGKVAKSAD